MRYVLTALIALALGLVAASPAAAGFEDYGYLSLFDISRTQNGGTIIRYNGAHMKFFHDIPATIIEVPTYLGCNPDEDWLAPADVADSLAEFAADDGFKLMLNLHWVLFEKANQHCAPFDSDKLRTDWESRLTQYAAAAGGHFNSGNTAYMLIHTEVNNSPDITPAQMVEVTLKARELFPGVPAAAGYPTTNGAGPLPANFPWPLDIVYTWAYDVTDPRAASYVNGRFADFLGRLSPSQTVGVLVEGFDNGDANPRLGISGEYLGTLARRWCAFAKNQPRVEHVAGFYWGVWTGPTGGTDDLIDFEAGQGIDALERAHRVVARAARNQLDGSCWATG